MVLPFFAAVAPWAPIIGGALGALGQLFAPKPEAQTVTNSIDIQRLRDDAEAAGFNPLTIIRGGGLAGYGSQHIPAGPDMRLANAFQTFGSGVAQWDPYGALRGAAELELAKKQVAAFGKTGAPAGMSFQTPKAVGTYPGVVNLPLERIGTGQPQEAPGAVSDIGWLRTEHGWTTVPSKDAKERIEDDLFQQTMWTVRNQVLPDLMLMPQPFPSWVGDRQNYEWNPWTRSWSRRSDPRTGGGF